MQYLHSLRRCIDRITGSAGHAVAWLAVALVFVGVLNTVLRYLGGWLQQSLTSNAMGEIQWMIFAAMFLLGAAWTLREDAHVRVDVLYERFGPRGKAVVNLLGTLLLLLPFCAFAWWSSWDYVLRSVLSLESTADAGKLPLWPAKLLILGGFGLLGLQALSLLLKSVATLLDEGEASGADPTPSPGTEAD